jgi:hypothetical protein
MTYEKIEVEPNIFMIKRIDDDGKEWWIPIANDNSDYQAYQAYLASLPSNSPQAGA